MHNDAFDDRYYRNAFAMVSFISRDEKRINKEIEKEKRSHTSSITNANMFGLVDDDWDKGFLSIYGEEIKPGKDHGTAYMVLNSFRFSFVGNCLYGFGYALHDVVGCKIRDTAIKVVRLKKSDGFFLTNDFRNVKIII